MGEGWRGEKPEVVERIKGKGVGVQGNSGEGYEGRVSAGWQRGGGEQGGFPALICVPPLRPRGVSHPAIPGAEGRATL